MRSNDDWTKISPLNNLGNFLTRFNQIKHLLCIESERQEFELIRGSQEAALQDTQRQLDNLTRMRYRDQINDETYTKERQVLQETINRLTIELQKIGQEYKGPSERAAEVFRFAAQARVNFRKSPPEQQKAFILDIGSNLFYEAGNLVIVAKKEYEPIINNYKPLKEEFDRIETTNFASTKEKTEALTSVFSSWHGM